jgi:plastocyanin
MKRSPSLRPFAAALAGAVLTLAACGGGDDEAAATTAPGAEATATDAPAAAPAGGEAAITISGFAFSGVTEVAAGTTVTISNEDSAPHTVSADDGSFDTGNIAPGESATITLSTAGTFAYHCNVHASMKGSITVT